MNIDIASLERATLDAVAPGALEEIPGWLLPFDSSTVGRAISAVPLQHSAHQPIDLRWIEARYKAYGLHTQFRVADIAGLAALQAALHEFGYQAQKPTLTMVGTELQWTQKRGEWSVQLSDSPTRDWESVYLASDFNPIDGANRVKALSRSNCAMYAWVAAESGPVAAGAASFSHGWASLHGLRTRANARRIGAASAVIRALGGQAQKRGLNRCFLQVEEENINAVSLYNHLGFQVAWRYHYWR